MTDAPGFEDDFQDPMADPDEIPVDADTASAEPFYPNVGEFVQDYLLPHFPWEGVEDVLWCRDWWAHAPALAVLSDVHTSWEDRRLDPPGMAAWWRDVAFPLMEKLTTGPRSPFRNCEHGHRNEAPNHEADRQLPANPWPTGLFD